jgi:hypothetical protein
MLAPAALRRQGFFDSDTVGGLLDAHLAGREDLSRQLWGLLAFSLWLERSGRAESVETRLAAV